MSEFSRPSAEERRRLKKEYLEGRLSRDARDNPPSVEAVPASSEGASVSSKRPVSLTGPCWFCEQGKASANSAVAVILQKTLSYEKFDYGSTRGTTHRFHETTVAVPRCTKCQAIHERWKRWGEKGIAAGLVFGLVTSIVVAIAVWVREHAFWKGVGMGLMQVVISPFTGAAIGGLLGWAVPRPRGVKAVRHAARHDAVTSMGSEGWVVASEQDYYGTNTSRTLGRTTEGMS